MIDVYHCPMCSRLLKCEGVVSIGGHELPMFQCEDCLVKKAVFGPGTEEFEMAYTFCVDSAGRCFDPVEELGESDEDRDCDDDSEPDPVDVHLPNRERNPALKPIQFLCHAVMPMGPKVIAGRILDVSCWGDFRGCWPIPGIVSAEYEERTEAIIGSRIRVRNGDGSTHVEEVTAWIG